jgi:hypothetical protein
MDQQHGISIVIAETGLFSPAFYTALIKAGVLGRIQMHAKRRMSSDRKPLVFISHSSSDKQTAIHVVERLRARGLEVWIDHERIQFGDSIPARIAEGLSACDFVLVLVSEAFCSSPWCRAEYAPILKREIEEGSTLVIPVLLNEDVELPPLLASKRYVRCYGSTEEWEVDSLCSQVCRQVSHCTMEEILPVGSERVSIFAHNSKEPVLGLIISKVLEEVRIPRLATDGPADRDGLLSLYRAVDRMIDQFLAIVDESSRILIKYRSANLWHPEPHVDVAAARHEIAIANRKLYAIARDMREISESLNEVLSKDTELAHRLKSLLQTSFMLADCEGSVLMTFGAPLVFPSTSDKREEHIGGLYLGDFAYSWNTNDYTLFTTRLEEYRSELRKVISDALSA